MTQEPAGVGLSQVITIVSRSVLLRLHRRAPGKSATAWKHKRFQ
jgi:hypothetical protein